MGKCCKAEKYKWCNSEDSTYKDSDGKEYCLFHTPIELRKKEGLINDFNTRLNQIKFDYENNFSGCEFNKDSPLPSLRMSPSKGTFELSFKDCKFFYPVQLINSKFDNCDFTGAAFWDVNFANSTFNGRAIFNDVTFNGKVNFRNCIFTDTSKTIFENVKYEYLNFKDAKFLADCTFQQISQINKSSAHVSFSDIIIGSNCKLKFNHCSLMYSIFKPRGEGNIEFVDCNLERVSFENADLSNIIFTQIVLSKTYFLGAKVIATRFIDCKFNNVSSLGIRRIILFDELCAKGEDRFISSIFIDKPTSQVLEETYCSFKNNYENNKNYVVADMFHFSEMEMRRLRIGEDILKRYDSNKKLIFLYAKILAYFRQNVFSFYPWYKRVSGYGTSYVRAFLLLMTLLLFFSTLYMFTGLPGIEYEIGYPSSIKILFIDYFESFLYALGVLIPGLSKYYLTDVTSSTTQKCFIFEFILLWSQISLFILALKRHFKR